MKRINILLATALAIFPLGSCGKVELIDPNGGQLTKETAETVSEKEFPYSLCAIYQGTKTSIDDKQTKWSADDAMNVFHAEDGTTEYGTNDRFSISEDNLASGLFNGTITGVLDAGKNYDWYALYPFNPDIETPGSNPVGTVTIGHGASSSLKQNGNSSTAHLAGTAFPLYGKASGVAAADQVVLAMKPLASIIEVNVMNKSDAPLIVRDVTFTATEDIVGAYTVNFAGASPELAKASDASVSATARLSVTGGTAILTNSSETFVSQATFYLAVKPFSASSGTLTVSVNGKEREISLSKETTFASGKIKKINFTYEQSPTDFAGSKVVLAKKDAAYYALSSVSDGKRLKATPVEYSSGTFETADSHLIWTVGKNSEDYSYSFCNSSSNYLTWDSTDEDSNNASTASGQYWLYIGENTTDGSQTILSKNDNSRLLSKNSGSELFAFYQGTQNDRLFIVPATHITDPTIADIEDPAKVSENGGSISVPYTVYNSTSATLTVAKPSEVTWITDVTVSGTDISFTVAANTTSAERSCILTASYTDAANKTFTVTQAAAGSSVGWTRVTTVDQITSGGTFILGYEATASSGVLIPMRTEGSATTSSQGYIYSGSTAGSPTSGTINMATIAVTSAYEFAITPSSSVSGAVNIKMGTSYLGNENAKNCVKLYSTESSHTAFTPTVGANDVVTLTIAANGTYKTLQYNTSAPRFAVYSGTQKNLVLYKSNGASPTPVAATGYLELPAESTSADIINGSFGEGTSRNYSYCYDKTKYASMWVAYPLTNSHTEGSASSSKWSYNPQFGSEYQVHVKDKSYGSNYNASQYARGHQCPNASRHCSTEMNAQTYYVTNQTPQIQNSFNSGVWSSLEDAVRNLTTSADTVYVVTGPCYQTVGGSEPVNNLTSKDASITPTSLPVPNYYWKAVLKVKRDGDNIIGASAIGFWLNHEATDKDFTTFVQSVDYIESKIGYNLFSNLPEPYQAAAEGNSSWETFKNY